jgi:hypothetical protein
MATSMNMAVCWDAARCSPVHTDRRFRRAYCLYHQNDETLTVRMLKAVNISETSASIYQTTRATSQNTAMLTYG